MAGTAASSTDSTGRTSLQLDFLHHSSLREWKSEEISRAVIDQVFCTQQDRNWCYTVLILELHASQSS